MRLSRKLLLIPISALIAFIVIWVTIEHFDQQKLILTQRINNKFFPVLNKMLKIQKDLNNIQKIIKDPVALAMDEDNMYKKAKSLFETVMKEYTSIQEIAITQKETLKSIQTETEAWFKSSCALIDNIDNMDINDAMKRNNVLFDQLTENIVRLHENKMSDIALAQKSSESISNDSKDVIDMVLFFCFVVLFTLSYIVFKSIMTTVITSSKIATTISSGDLREFDTSDGDRDSEVGQLISGLDQMRRGFSAIAENVTDQSHKLSIAANFLNDGATSIGSSATNLKEYAQLVAGASAQQSASISAISMRSENIAHLISDLSEGASNISIQIQGMAVSAEQASVSISKVATANEEMSATITSSNTTLANVSESLLSISSSVEELTATLSDVARSCNQARTASSTTTEQANASGLAMKKLNDSAIKIGKVVDVIHDIADQTNMLALNATIEAARAGEAGKGFAVVAKEIKDLARQTAEATGQIAQQISTMQEDCSTAVQNIDAVVISVKDNEGIIESIAESANQHQIVAQQISQSMAEAAAGAEEVAAGSSDMRVVAFEISQNSSDAARGGEEIAQRCAELAETSDSFASKVSNVEDGISDIVQSTNEIHTGIDHVAGAAAELNKSSSSFSAIAETVLESTITIGDISGKMREAVSKFKFSRIKEKLPPT
jgi:methyl-accepting chemotaxis protein